jgi:hypothetical protein
MPTDLYEQDPVTWSEQQANLLRRLAGGERVNEQIDWPHVIDELRDLGAAQVRACRSWLKLALIHLLKMASWPDELSIRAWQTEVENFSVQFEKHYLASMRDKVDTPALYRQALREVRSLPWPSPRALPDVCPFTTEDFASPDTTTADLLAKLDPPA